MNAKEKLNLLKAWSKISLGKDRTAFISKEMIKVESLFSKGI